ncbi:MAG: (d)CMP kinase [Lachnospiraceae bacterium]|nr:(d)CMP kinase [Lachnospiraceae bacterium]
MSKNIAIDGPAGAGKSTIARMLAEKLGLVYVDTGAMYRTMALLCLRRSVSLASEEEVVDAVLQAEIRLGYEDGVQQVILNGENVTEAIRSPEVSAAASRVSVYGPVRSRLVRMQQELAKETDVVMDGRDIGTVVLPDAFLKVFLTASPAERARRRAQELRAKGESCDEAKIEAEIRERDARDMNREISPLKQAEDAERVDTTRMTIEEVVACVTALYQKKTER